MTDIEMTKLCADAMGWESKASKDIHGVEHIVRRMPQDHMQDCWCVFDPLRDDAHAMALVKKLGLTIDPQEDFPPFTWRVCVSDNGDWDKQPYAQGLDLNRIIVECVSMMKTTR